MEESLRPGRTSPRTENVAKRMLLHFGRGAFPAYERADDRGMPEPGAPGIPGVTGHTPRPRGRPRTPRPDPGGRPLPAPAPRPKLPGSRWAAPRAARFAWARAEQRGRAPPLL